MTIFQFAAISEVDVAVASAEAIGARHVAKVVSQSEFVAALPEIVWYLDTNRVGLKERVYADTNEAERAKFWAGRKNAFPAVGRMSPDYYCMDGTIPRRKLGQVLTGIEGTECRLRTFDDVVTPLDDTTRVAIDGIGPEARRKTVPIVGVLAVGDPGEHLTDRFSCQEAGQRTGGLFRCRRHAVESDRNSKE